MQKIIFILAVHCIFLTSCRTVNLGNLREEIIRQNPDVKSVGFITDFTDSDDKYIAIDIVFYNDSRLYLTLVNWTNRKKTQAPFHLAGIGIYGLDIFYRSFYDSSEPVTHVKEIKNLNKYNHIPIQIIADALDIKFSNNNGDISNINIVIKNYDKLFKYIDSLPTYDESFGDPFYFENNFTRIKTGRQFPSSADKTETIQYLYCIIMKTDLHDRFYHFQKRPDYKITDRIFYLAPDLYF